MEINVEKTFLLLIDKDQKRRKETPVADLEINSERLQTMNFHDACRYLGYFSFFHLLTYSLVQLLTLSHSHFFTISLFHFFTLSLIHLFTFSLVQFCTFSLFHVFTWTFALFRLSTSTLVFIESPKYAPPPKIPTVRLFSPSVAPKV